MSHRQGTKAPTHISDEAESDLEEPDEPTQVVDDKELREVEVLEPPTPKTRAFSVSREDIARHGASDECRGCTAIARGWKRPSAHSTACRERVVAGMLEDGGPSGRAQVATENALREGHGDAELSRLLCDKVREGKRSLRARINAGRERRI